VAQTLDEVETPFSLDLPQQHGQGGSHSVNDAGPIQPDALVLDEPQ